MAIINNMPSGGGGAKFASGILTDKTHVFEVTIQNKKYFCLDKSLVGFEPKSYYAFTKYKRDTTVIQYTCNVGLAVGYMPKSESHTEVCAVCCNVQNPSDYSGTQYKTEYENNLASETKGTKFFPANDKYIVLFTTDAIKDIDYCEWYVWG